MTTEKKENRRYVFTVEGETEQWYFEWLQEQINDCDESKFKVSIVSKVQQSPKNIRKPLTRFLRQRLLTSVIMRAMMTSMLKNSRIFYRN